MKLCLPKSYLSWSAFNLWNTDRNAFRRRYYENEKPPYTAEMMFGKDIAKMMEDPDAIAQHPILKHIPTFSEREKCIKVKVNGVPVLGYLDSFDPDTLAFRDLKTGHLKKDGSPPWDNLKVYKHGQLVFYSTIVEEKYGKVHNTCYLDWIRTEFKTKTVEFDGHTLESETRELQLTNEIQTFARKVYKWERDRMRRSILQAANEIHNDYEQYRTSKTPERTG